VFLGQVQGIEGQWCVAKKRLQWLLLVVLTYFFE
jgi:hypothetical protein